MAKTMPGTWSKLAESAELQRSSHSICDAGGSTYIFGGELKPREPRDNYIHVVESAGSEGSVKLSSIQDLSPAPSARVGSGGTTCVEEFYIFSGRGGVEMKPIEEHGSLWCFKPKTSSWVKITPADPDAPFPKGRSYHAMTSTYRYGDADRHSRTIYVHAGCPESGRLNDLWAFDVETRVWKKLRDAPGAPRGGASICVDGSQAKLYRMNGFDGKNEIGGCIDIYAVEDDRWSTRNFEADGEKGPGPRSVSALLAPEIHGSDDFLVTLFGESDPSNLGHQGAGKMLGDIWVYIISRHAWVKVRAKARKGQKGPAPRGWFAADLAGNEGIVVAGGLAEDNGRLGDVWVLELRTGEPGDEDGEE